MVRLLARLGLVLMVCITATSAFIRHHQAGFGCVPWPECYASQPAPGAAPAKEAAASGAVTAEDVARVFHRIAASTVAIFVLLIAFVGWGALQGAAERIVVGAALVVTLGLSWLGIYSPRTIIPAVTQANVLGGFALAGLLAWIGAREARPDPAGRPAVAKWIAVALAVLAVQTASGTLISARHAVTACGLFTCGDDTGAAIAGWDVFDVFRAGVAGVAPQILHRTLAFVTAFFILVAARAAGGRLGIALVVLVIAQVATAMGTVSGLSPLVSATLHNGLTATMVVILAWSHRRATRESHPLGAPARA